MDSFQSTLDAHFNGLQDKIILEHQKMVEGTAELLREQQEEYNKEKSELKEEIAVICVACVH